jgi:hypothetical protein
MFDKRREEIAFLVFTQKSKKTKNGKKSHFVMQMGQQNKPANVIITYKKKVLVTDSNTSIQNKIKLFYELCVGPKTTF